MPPLPHLPEGNGTRPVSPRPAASHPHASGPPRPAAGGVSRLDRITLQLGVAVAVVIAVCSYAVSATSLYALGVQAGYSWWQAAAVPVVADGPAIYGMFRIISRSRRGAKGAGYGWLLVGCGTLASIGGNVAHAHPNLVAQAIAAAIPLAVLAMLEGLKGDAGEVTRLAAQAAAGDGARTLRAGRPLPQATTVRRSDPTANLGHPAAGTFGPGRRALPAGPDRTDPPRSGRGCRRPMPSRGRTASPGRPAPWPRPPAVAAAAPPASCNATAHRAEDAPREPAPLAAARRRPRLCLPRHPGPAPALPPPPPRRPPAGSRRPQPPAVGTGCSCRDPGCGQVAKHPLGSLVPHGVKDATTNRARVLAWWTRHPQANIGLATGHRFDVLDVDGPAGAQAIQELAATHGLQSSGPLVRTGGGGWHFYLAPTGLGNVSPADLRACGLAGPGRLCGRPTQPPRLRPPLPVGPRPRPRHPTRPGARGAARAAPAPPPPATTWSGPASQPSPTARVTATRGRPWPRSWPGSPPPPSATATASCGSRPATSTTWSPPAPSTTARSTRAPGGRRALRAAGRGAPPDPPHPGLGPPGRPGPPRPPTPAPQPRTHPRLAARRCGRPASETKERG